MKWSFLHSIDIISIEKKLFLFSLLCFLTSVSISQTTNYTSFTTEDGLASNEVYAIHEDAQGYIWFATNRGVSRYDGYEFINYTTKDGLVENLTKRIFEDRFNRLWFVSYEDRLSYLEDNKIQRYKYNDRLHNRKMGPSHIISLETTKDSTLLIGAIGLGINCRKQIDKNGKFQVNDDYVKYGFFSTKIDYSSKPDILDTEYWFDLEKRQICIKDSFLLDKSTVAMSSFSTVLKMGKNKHLISYWDKLYSYDNGEVKFLQKYKGIIRTIFEKEGCIYVTILGKGILKYDKSNLTNCTDTLFRGKQVGCSFLDHNGNLWVGTNGKGVLKVPSLYAFTRTNKVNPLL